MLTYDLDIEKGSLWLRKTPSETARNLPFFCTEAGIFYARSRFVTSRSNKESYLLFFTIEGKGTLTQSGRTVTLNPGQALLIDCRTPQSYGTAKDSDRWVHYWLHLDGEGVKTLFSILDPEHSLNVLNVARDAFTAQFDALLKDLETDDLLTLLQMSASMHVLLNLMASEMNSSANLSDSNAGIIKNSAAYIRLHCCENLTLDDLCARTGLCKSYYVRLFKQYIGVPPYNYLLSCRITKAKELLECTNDPIAVIAEKTGFLDASAFSVRFLAMTRETPQHYRRNALRQKSENSH